MVKAIFFQKNFLSQLLGQLFGQINSQVNCQVNYVIKKKSQVNCQVNYVTKKISEVKCQVNYLVKKYSIFFQLLDTDVPWGRSPPEMAARWRYRLPSNNLTVHYNSQFSVSFHFGFEQEAQKCL